MTELIKDSGIYAFSVPVDATSIQLYGTGGIVDEIRWNIVKQAGKGLKIKTSSKRLPPGNYSIICTSANATEADAAKVVHTQRKNSYPLMYKIYSEGLREAYTSDWRDSLSSLLRSLNLNEPNYLIIKRT